ncbi:MAG: class I SAM-dependent methyltransferase, partial [archaeon]
NEKMYPIKKNTEDNWLYYVFAGFKIHYYSLKNQEKKVNSLALIGSGNGVDAIGAHYIFKEANQVYLTDIDPETLPLAIKNVKKNKKPGSNVSINGFVGDVCQPLEQENIKADMIYANLPNIPLWKNTQTNGFGLSTFYTPREKIRVPSILKKNLLELQLHFLNSTKPCLNSGGNVIQVIGGRFPAKNFKILFDEAGFNQQQLCAGLKLQTETREVISGYSKAEKENNNEFIFYDYKNAVKSLNKGGETSLITGKKTDYLEKRLKDYSMTATQALKEHKKGMKIGHTCHVLKGNLKNKKQPK